MPEEGGRTQKDPFKRNARVPFILPSCQMAFVRGLYSGNPPLSSTLMLNINN